MACNLQQGFFYSPSFFYLKHPKSHLKQWRERGGRQQGAVGISIYLQGFIMMELQMLEHGMVQNEEKADFEKKSGFSVTSDECFHRGSLCRQAGRRATLVTLRQPNRRDPPFPLQCLLLRLCPSYTQTHTQPHIKINTHHLSPVERSISRAHMVSSGSQALLTRSADVDGSFKQPDS